MLNNPSDLGPGDRKSASFDWNGFEIIEITSATHPYFEGVYSKLWEEFGQKGELESRETITRRFEQNSSSNAKGHHIYYQLLSVWQEGKFAAACDHSVILLNPAEEAVVHLSHILLAPSQRGTGLTGWVRAWPVQAARQCLSAAGRPNLPITVVAEMDPFDATSEASVRRTKGFKKGGLRRVDPHPFDYWQPDFRPSHEIDQGRGPKPLSLQLLLRQVGKEDETEISALRLHRIITALYTMYGENFRAQDMAPVWKHLEAFPLKDGLKVSLE